MYLSPRGKIMEQYQNTKGRSGVIAYEIGPDYIRIQFQDNEIYLYTYESTGSEDIETMKTLAQQGSGLNTFINTSVRKRFARKE
jgi:hypothetical protein